jgi:hypothetical protein
MNVEMAAWLHSRATALRVGTEHPINIKKLLEGFGIHLLLEPAERRSGALSQSVDRKWFVVVRGKRSMNSLTAIDRFTAAHELGHFLLITHWNYSPSIKNKRDYYECEELCNQFASRLLIDRDAVESLVIQSPRECLGVIRDLAKRYLVSNEAVARAIVETHSKVSVCAFMNSPNGGWTRSWGVSSLKGITRFGVKHVNCYSICAEMKAMSEKILGKTLTDDKIDCATETINDKAGLSVVMIKTTD